MAQTDAGDGETHSVNMALGKVVPWRGSSAITPVGDPGMAKGSFRRAFKGDKWKSFAGAVYSSLQT